MRFLFTACWHLGRRLHGRDRTEDQAHALDTLVELAAEVRPDAVLVAGDVYELASPALEHVELADDVFKRLVRSVGVPVVALAGGDRPAAPLSFGGALLAEAGLHVIHGSSDPSRPIVFEDADGIVRVHALPPRRTFAESRADLERSAAVAGPRSVLLAHAVAASSDEGGAEAGCAVLTPDDLAGFRVALLGHGHRPGAAKAGRVVCCGAPLALDIDDADEERGASVVEVDRAGTSRVEHVAFPARRAVRRLEGRLDTLLAAEAGPCADLVLLRLTDPEPRPQLLEQVRAAYPELLRLERAPEGRRPLDVGLLLADWAARRGEEALVAAELNVLEDLLEAAGLAPGSAS